MSIPSVLEDRSTVCAWLASRGAHGVSWMLSGISTVTASLASRCTSIEATAGCSPAITPTCAGDASRLSAGRDARLAGLLPEDVLSVGRPGTRHAAVHLLDGVARMLAHEAERAEEYGLCERLVLLTEDVIDALDEIVGVAT